MSEEKSIESKKQTAELKVVISADTTELDKAIDKAKELSALSGGGERSGNNKSNTFCDSCWELFCSKVSV